MWAMMEKFRTFFIKIKKRASSDALRDFEPPLGPI